MNTIDSNKDKQYVQEIFNARLNKSEKKNCPNCGVSALQYYKPLQDKKHRKLLYCGSCYKPLSILNQTVFHQTQLPIELWLHITRHILEKGSEIQAKELHLDFGISMPTSYRCIEKVQTWQAQNNIHKPPRKRKINRKYRTGIHIIQEMMLRSMPPLFENDSNSTNLKNQNL